MNVKLSSNTYRDTVCVWFPSLSLVAVNTTAVSQSVWIGEFCKNKTQSVNDEKKKKKTNKNKNDDDVTEEEEEEDNSDNDDDEEQQRMRQGKSVRVCMFCCCCWFQFRCVLKYSNGFRQCVNLKGLVAIWEM